MSQKLFHSALHLAIVSLIAFCGCGRKAETETGFTKADSLTETYLALQDTVLQAWNTMTHDDNRKLMAMEKLLDELRVSIPEKRDEFRALRDRLEALKSLRYDQQSMFDPEVVAEYDFASNALVSELISIAETEREFASSTTVQQLVDSIRAAEERVNNYRDEYDEVASRFNAFIERYNQMLTEVKDDSGLKKKPLFQMAAE